MTKKPKRIPYPDISEGASMTETTGLFPRPPLDEAEYESYQDVYGMEVPKKKE